MSGREARRPTATAGYRLRTLARGLQGRERRTTGAPPAEGSAEASPFAGFARRSRCRPKGPGCCDLLGTNTRRDDDSFLVVCFFFLLLPEGPVSQRSESSGRDTHRQDESLVHVPNDRPAFRRHAPNSSLPPVG